MGTYIIGYILLGALNVVFQEWSRRVQYKMMGEECGRWEIALEAVFLWPAYLLLNLAMWAYVLIKSRKAQ